MSKLDEPVFDQLNEHKLSWLRIYYYSRCSTKYQIPQRYVSYQLKLKVPGIVHRPQQTKANKKDHEVPGFDRLV
jgi:hypothetical protein